MACEGNGVSDERIGEALIEEIFEDQLNRLPSQDVPILTPRTANTEPEGKIVTQLKKISNGLGDVGKTKDFQDAVDAVTSGSGTMWERFQKVAVDFFKDGITWEKIVTFFFYAGRVAFKLVEKHIPHSVKEILLWTVDFFKKRLLAWILDHGGWISSFSELAVASVRGVSTLGPRGSNMLCFVCGMAAGSFITWRLTR